MQGANPATSLFCSQRGFALKLEATYKAEESAKTLVEKALEKLKKQKYITVAN